MDSYLVRGEMAPEIIPARAFSFVMLALGMIAMPMLRWAIRIRRLEQPIIREAEETLERGRHLRHRQRVARR